MFASRNPASPRSEPVSNPQSLFKPRGQLSCTSVCLVTDSEEPSGVGEHMLALIGALHRHHRIVLVCSRGPKVSRLLDGAVALGVDTLALDWHGSEWPSRFAGWLSQGQIDLCHVHAGIFWEAQDIAAIAKRSGVPVVVRTEHLPFVSDDTAHRTRYAEAIRDVDQLVCVSRQARDSFIDAGTAPERITVIRNGAPVTRCSADRAAVRAALGLDWDSRVVLTVARYTEQKDHRTLLDAIPSILASEPKARFVWVGTGPLQDMLMDAVRRQGLDQHVLFLGQQDDVPKLMGAADILALTSRFEGLPLVVLEAMAVGIPVVATRVGGTEEAVRHGVTGLLVEPGRPAEVAAALIEVLGNPAWAAQLGERGRIRAQRCFSAERMARETLALYAAVWNRRLASTVAQRSRSYGVQSPGVSA
jgi:glycosyltransferase involved in cell wall biosynthesis